MGHFEQASQEEGQEMAEVGEEQDFGDATQKQLQLCYSTVKGMSFATADSAGHALILYHALVWKEA